MELDEQSMPEQLELFPGDLPPRDTILKPEHSDSSSRQTDESQGARRPSSLAGVVRSDIKKHEMKFLAEMLRLEIEQATNRKISLVITNNTSNMMSIKVDPAQPMVQVRVHHMFLDAPKDVRCALAHLVKHPRSRKYAGCLRKFIDSRTHQIRPARPVHTTIHAKGAVYDLRPIFDELNAAYFQGELDVAITWGRYTKTSGRSIRFGSYYESSKLIRIHQRLDQAFVPLFVVRYIVYHEMLHAHLGLEKNENGRRQIHSRKFKNIEAAYPEYQAAVAWIENQNNLNRLLRPGRARKRR